MMSCVRKEYYGSKGHPGNTWEISERATWCIRSDTHPTLEKLRDREREILTFWVS